jgi:hypothetical protein
MEFADLGVKYLSGLKELKAIRLGHTRVTPAGKRE